MYCFPSFACLEIFTFVLDFVDDTTEILYYFSFSEEYIPLNDGCLLFVANSLIKGCVYTSICLGMCRLGFYILSESMKGPEYFIDPLS